MAAPALECATSTLQLEDRYRSLLNQSACTDCAEELERSGLVPSHMRELRYEDADQRNVPLVT